MSASVGSHKLLRLRIKWGESIEIVMQEAS